VTAVARACLVDVYDTILRSPFVGRITTIAEWLGVSVEDWLAELEKTRLDRDRGKLSTAAAYDQALRGLGIDPDGGRVDDLLRLDAEFTRAHLRLFDDTVPFFEWLRSQGIGIALVSNCGDTTRGQLEQLGVIPLVDAVVLSCEVGSSKPSPEIYVTALADLGVAAADAVFIDDQPTFCLGAEAVGVRPIRIARDGVDSVRFFNSVNGANGAAAEDGWDFPVVPSLLDAKALV
jgi:HAD superfamily hydrolase (TIGR01509 family)